MTEDIPMMSRGFSMVAENMHLVNQTRSRVLDVFEEEEEPEMLTDSAFRLPNLESLRGELRTFVEKELIDSFVKVSLEKSHLLNWWLGLDIGAVKCPALWPIATKGDGNCLLHAASLALWGLHDRLLILRRALNECVQRYEEELFQRWRTATVKTHAAAGLRLQDSEWKREWSEVCQLANPVQRGRSQHDSYAWLEPIHILALAHVLKRPIIVIAESVVRDVDNRPLQAQTIGGVYLPLTEGLFQHYRRPIFLTYHSAHYSALIPSQTDSVRDELIPLVDPVTGALLPIRFPPPSLTRNDRETLLTLFDRHMELSWLRLRPTSASSGNFSLCCPSLLPQRRVRHDAFFENEERPAPRDEWQRKCIQRLQREWKQGRVPCVILDKRLPPGYDEMISNYLLDAGSRQSSIFSTAL